MKTLKIFALCITLLTCLARSQPPQPTHFHEENINSLSTNIGNWYINASRKSLEISAGSNPLDVATIPPEKYTMLNILERLNTNTAFKDDDTPKSSETWLNIWLTGSNKSIVKIVKKQDVADLLIDLMKVAIPRERTHFKVALKNNPIRSPRASEIDEVIARLEQSEASPNSTENPIENGSSKKPVDHQSSIEIPKSTDAYHSKSGKPEKQEPIASAPRSAIIVASILAGIGSLIFLLKKRK